MDQPDQNPIVAMAMRLRARRDVDAAVDAATSGERPLSERSTLAVLAAFADDLTLGARRLNSILGEKTGVKIVRLENPLRVRVRFREHRIALDFDPAQELVNVTGMGLEGEYQPNPEANVPSFINLSQLSTEAGYGDALTPGAVLKRIAQDAELPRPAHLDEPGPMRF